MNAKNPIVRSISGRGLTLGVLLAILIAAFAVRFATFQRYLPYLDNNDESNMYLLARDWRGVEDVPVVPEWLEGYPPLYVWVNEAVQQVVEAHWAYPWIFPAQYFTYTRLLAAVAGGLTALLIMALGWQLGDGVAAAFAGIVWALSPFVIDYNSFAIPDPLVYLFSAAALVTALRAWRRELALWLLASLLAGIAAIYSKYSAVFVLIPWGVVTLALLRRAPRRWLPALVIDLALGAAAAAYLVFGYGALQLNNREAASVRSGLSEIFDLAREINNWRYAILPVGVALFLIAVALGIAAYVVSRRRGWRVVRWQPISMIALYGLVGIAITTTFTNIALPAGKICHSLPITVGVLGVWGAAISQTYWTLSAAWRKHPRRIRWLPQIAIAGTALSVVVPLIVGGAQSIQTLNLTHTALLAQVYADASLPDDGLILLYPESQINGLFNRPWGGYSGATAFDWWLEDPTTSTPQALAARGINYFVLRSDDWKIVDNPDALHSFLAKLTHLHTITPDEGRIGPQIDFYRMLPPQTAANTVFGSLIQLAGYDLSTAQPTPGADLTLRPYWRALSQPTLNYSLFAHLYPASDETTVIAQYDGSPALPTRLTPTWNDPDELIMGAQVKLTIPPETPPGDYTLGVGLYDFVSGQRLQTPNGDRAVISIVIGNSTSAPP